MVLKNCDPKSLLLMIGLFFIGFGPWFTLRADIIDDVNQLDPKQNPKIPANPKLPATPAKTLVPSNVEEPNHINMPEVKTNKKTSTDLEKNGSKKAMGQQRRNAPIHLQSDGTSTYSRNGSVAHLQKNVVISQDDVRLQADEAKVLLQKGKEEQNNVQTVELNGKVNVSRFAKDPAERVTARSDKALFDNNAQIVTLDGNARLWRDGHLIKGDRIIYDIISGLIKVDRAQGVLQPEKSAK